MARELSSHGQFGKLDRPSRRQTYPWEPVNRDDYINYGSGRYGAAVPPYADYYSWPRGEASRNYVPVRGYNEDQIGHQESRDVAPWIGNEENAPRQSGHRGKGPKSYLRSDQRIMEDVCDRLTEDGQLDASEISVAVQNGEVTLSGTVSSRFEKRRAEDCSDSVTGVQHTQNNLRLPELALGGGPGAQGGM